MICFNHFEFKQMLCCIECIHDRLAVNDFEMCNDVHNDGSMVECDVKNVHANRVAEIEVNERMKKRRDSLLY